MKYINQENITFSITVLQFLFMKYFNKQRVITRLMNHVTCLIASIILTRYLYNLFSFVGYDKVYFSAITDDSIAFFIEGVLSKTIVIFLFIFAMFQFVIPRIVTVLNENTKSTLKRWLFCNRDISIKTIKRTTKTMLFMNDIHMTAPDSIPQNEYDLSFLMKMKIIGLCVLSEIFICFSIFYRDNIYLLTILSLFAILFLSLSFIVRPYYELYIDNLETKTDC